MDYIAYTLLLRAAYHAFFFSPLSRLPGPRFAAATELYLYLPSMAGKRMHLIHDLHKVRPLPTTGHRDLRAYSAMDQSYA